MTQHARVPEVKPGYEEYGRRHEKIWPETAETLKEAGVRPYTIFRHGLALFSFPETDNVERTQAYLA